MDGSAVGWLDGWICCCNQIRVDAIDGSAVGWCDRWICCCNRIRVDSINGSAVGWFRGGVLEQRQSAVDVVVGCLCCVELVMLEWSGYIAIGGVSECRLRLVIGSENE